MTGSEGDVNDRVSASVDEAAAGSVVRWSAAAALVLGCTVAASSGDPGELAVRPQALAGARLDVADLLGRVPSWLTVVAASVTGTLMLLVTVPLLVLGLRALWRLLLQLAASARRPAAPGRRRGRNAVHRPPAAAGSTGAGATERVDPTRLRGALAAPADRAATTLRSGSEREAGHEVIRCWEAVEAAAAASGAARRPGDTPAEFTRGVLQSLRVDPEPLDTLLQVYGRARFSRTPLTSAEVGRARAAFAVVAEQLGSG